MNSRLSLTGGRRPGLVIIVALVAAAFALATTGPTQAGAASPTALTKISTGIVGAIDQLGTPVALDRGFFEKWGLDVTIARPYPTGVDQLNALQAGEIQIGQVGVPMIGAVIRGMDLVILGNYTGSAARLGSEATTALVAREGSGIKPGDLQSLKGKRIAASFGTINHLYVLGLLEKAGLKPSDVTLVNTPPQEMPVALLAKGIDAFSGWDPFPIMALKDVAGSYEVIRGGQVIGFLGFIVAMRDWAEKNADTVERFLLQSTSVKMPIDSLILSSAIRPGVIGLAKSLSRELGKDNIRVNNVLPGIIMTDRQRQILAVWSQKMGKSFDETKRLREAEIPLGRMGDPEDVANMIVFLASDRAKYVTGVTVPVDGGLVRSMM